MSVEASVVVSASDGKRTVGFHLNTPAATTQSGSEGVEVVPPAKCANKLCIEYRGLANQALCKTQNDPWIAPSILVYFPI